MLLTNSNQSSFVQNTFRLLADNAYRGIDHWRFRSGRGVDDGIVPEIEQAIYHQPFRDQASPMEKYLAGALRTQYPRNFKCWISPMQTTIAPDGSVYVSATSGGIRTLATLETSTREDFASLWNHQNISV